MKTISSIRTMLDRVASDRSLQLFLLILAGGAALRYYGLRNAENTDEYNEVMEALRVASGKLNYERWWKKGYQHILAIEYGIYFVIGFLLKIFQSPWDFAAKIVRDMEPLFLIGRYTTATLGTASIGLIYLIGRRRYNERVALIAAAMFAVETLNVWTSHLVNTDVPLTFFFLLSCYYSSRLYDSGKTREYAAAAFFCAVAVNIKIIGVGAVIIFVLAHVFRSIRTERDTVHSIFSRQLIYSAAAFAAGFILSNPAIIFGLRKFIAFHYGIYTNQYGEVPYAIGGNAYYTYMLLLQQDFGLPLLAMTLAAVSYSLFRREAWDVIFLLFLAVMFLILTGTTYLVQNRYLMTLFPALFLMVGRLLDDAADALFKSKPGQRAVLFAATVVLGVVPLVNSVAYARTLTEENTSMVSKRWIEENIPAGSRILMDAGRTIITAGPRLNQSWEQLEQKLNIIKNLKQGETYDSPQVRIVDSYAAVYFELLLKNMPAVTYDITTTELGKNLESSEYYRNNGYQYFIHNPDYNRSGDLAWRKKFPKSKEFYETFTEHFRLVKTFAPSEKRSGPSIRIYEIKQTSRNPGYPDNARN